MLRQWRQTHKSLEHTPGDIWSLRNPTPLIYCPAFKVTFVRERATATPPSERRFSINRRFWPAFLVIDLFNVHLTPVYFVRVIHSAWSNKNFFLVQGHRLLKLTRLCIHICVYVCIYICTVVPAVQCFLFTIKKISHILCEPCFPRRVRAQWKCRLILFTRQECIPVINLIMRPDNAFTPFQGLGLRDLGFKHSISFDIFVWKEGRNIDFKCLQFCKRMESRSLWILFSTSFYRIGG